MLPACSLALARTTAISKIDAQGDFYPLNIAAIANFNIAVIIQSIFLSSICFFVVEQLLRSFPEDKIGTGQRRVSVVVFKNFVYFWNYGPKIVPNHSTFSQFISDNGRSWTVKKCSNDYDCFRANTTIIQFSIFRMFRVINLVIFMFKTRTIFSYICAVKKFWYSSFLDICIVSFSFLQKHFQTNRWNFVKIQCKTSITTHSRPYNIPRSPPETVTYPLHPRPVTPFLFFFLSFSIDFFYRRWIGIVWNFVKLFFTENTKRVKIRRRVSKARG